MDERIYEPGNILSLFPPRWFDALASRLHYRIRHPYQFPTGVKIGLWSLVTPRSYFHTHFRASTRYLLILIYDLSRFYPAFFESHSRHASISSVCYSGSSASYLRNTLSWMRDRECILYYPLMKTESISWCFRGYGCSLRNTSRWNSLRNGPFFPWCDTWCYRRSSGRDASRRISCIRHRYPPYETSRNSHRTTEYYRGSCCKKHTPYSTSALVSVFILCFVIP